MVSQASQLKGTGSKVQDADSRHRKSLQVKHARNHLPKWF